MKQLSTVVLLITFCAKCKKYGLINCKFVVINNKIQNLLIIVDNMHLWIYNLGNLKKGRYRSYDKHVHKRLLF